jgi:hypothetical protein
VIVCSFPKEPTTEQTQSEQRLENLQAFTSFHANLFLFSAIQDASDPALDSTSISCPFGNPFACSVKTFTKSYIDALSRQRERKTLRASLQPKQKGNAAIASEIRSISRSRLGSML